MKDHYEQYMRDGVTPGDPERCPHIRRKCAGDESWDFCDLTERPSGRIKPCLLESGNICEEWEEIKREWANES